MFIAVAPAVLMHTVEDAFLNQLFMNGDIAIAPGFDWLVSPVNGLVSVALFLLAGLALHRFRTHGAGRHARTRFPTPSANR